MARPAAGYAHAPMARASAIAWANLGATSAARPSRSLRLLAAAATIAFN